MVGALKNILSSPFNYHKKIDFFRKYLYIFLFINTLSHIPIVHELYYYYGIAGTKGFSYGSTYFLTNLLSHPFCASRTWVVWIFIFGQLFFLALGYFKKFPLISSIMIYFFTVNLFTKGGIFFTGGEALINILLFCLIFIQNKDSFLQNVTNHVFYIIIITQIIFVYLFSTIYKLMDPMWISGEAIYYTVQIETYANDWVRTFFTEFKFISVIATYLTLVYQGVFGIFVFFKKTKIYLLFFGVLFHLLIALGMGIFFFGIIMILCYILFLDDVHIDKIQNLFKRKKIA